jgi:hypothetical protein
MPATNDAASVTTNDLTVKTIVGLVETSMSAIGVSYRAGDDTYEDAPPLAARKDGDKALRTSTEIVMIRHTPHSVSMAIRSPSQRPAARCQMKMRRCRLRWRKRRNTPFQLPFQPPSNGVFALPPYTPRGLEHPTLVGKLGLANPSSETPSVGRAAASCVSAVGSPLASLAPPLMARFSPGLLC